MLKIVSVSQIQQSVSKKYKNFRKKNVNIFINVNFIFLIIVELDKLIDEEENQNKSMQYGFYDDDQNDTNFKIGNVLIIICPFLNYLLFNQEKLQIFFH